MPFSPHTSPQEDLPELSVFIIKSSILRISELLERGVSSDDLGCLSKTGDFFFTIDEISDRSVQIPRSFSILFENAWAASTALTFWPVLM